MLSRAELHFGSPGTGPKYRAATRGGLGAPASELYRGCSGTSFSPLRRAPRSRSIGLPMATAAWRAIPGPCRGSWVCPEQTLPSLALTPGSCTSSKVRNRSGVDVRFSQGGLRGQAYPRTSFLCLARPPPCWNSKANQRFGEVLWHAYCRWFGPLMGCRRKENAAQKQTETLPNQGCPHGVLPRKNAFHPGLGSTWT